MMLSYSVLRPVSPTVTKGVCRLRVSLRPIFGSPSVPAKCVSTPMKFARAVRANETYDHIHRSSASRGGEEDKNTGNLSACARASCRRFAELARLRSSSARIARVIVADICIADRIFMPFVPRCAKRLYAGCLSLRSRKLYRRETVSGTSARSSVACNPYEIAPNRGQDFRWHIRLYIAE